MHMHRGTMIVQELRPKTTYVNLFILKLIQDLRTNSSFETTDTHTQTHLPSTYAHILYFVNALHFTHTHTRSRHTLNTALYI